MMAEPHPPRPEATWEDFKALPEDDRRELVDGKHCATVSTSWSGVPPKTRSFAQRPSPASRSPRQNSGIPEGPKH